MTNSTISAGKRVINRHRHQPDFHDREIGDEIFAAVSADQADAGTTLESVLLKLPGDAVDVSEIIPVVQRSFTAPREVDHRQPLGRDT